MLSPRNCPLNATCIQKGFSVEEVFCVHLPGGSCVVPGGPETQFRVFSYKGTNKGTIIQQVANEHGYTSPGEQVSLLLAHIFFHDTNLLCKNVISHVAQSRFLRARA